MNGIAQNGSDVLSSIQKRYTHTKWVLRGANTSPTSSTLVRGSKNAWRRSKRSSKAPTLHQELRTPPRRLQSNPASSKLLLSRSRSSKTSWAHNLLEIREEERETSVGRWYTIHKECIQWREWLALPLMPLFIWLGKDQPPHSIWDNGTDAT